MNRQEDLFYENIYTLMHSMIKFAEDEEQKGNLGLIAKNIIKRTGAKGTLFSIMKFHLFGDRDQEVENIEVQHTLRK